MLYQHSHVRLVTAERYSERSPARGATGASGEPLRHVPDRKAARGLDLKHLTHQLVPPGAQTAV